MTKRFYIHPQIEITSHDPSMLLAGSGGYAFDGGDIIPIEEQEEDDIIIDAKEFHLWEMGGYSIWDEEEEESTEEW